MTGTYYRVKKVQKRLGNGMAPERIDFKPVLDGEPVLEIDFGDPPSPFRFSLADADDVTGELDALEGVAAALLIRVRYDDRSKQGRVACGASAKMIHEIDPDREESASYTEFSEGFVNETRHPHAHLTNPVGEPERFYLIDP